MTEKFSKSKFHIFSNPVYDPTPRGIMEHLNQDLFQMKEAVSREQLIENDKRSRKRSNLPEGHVVIDLELKERFGRILNRAKTEDLECIKRLGCIFRSGQDRGGHPVIAIVGKWFHPDSVDLDKVFLYLVSLLDDIDGPYTVVYFHTATGPENRPGIRWMNEVYDNMEYRFKKNLKKVLIVHPTVWTKVISWWFTTFMAPAIKLKLHNVSGLEELYGSIEPSQVPVPAFISEHDISLNGYAGVAYSHTHSRQSSAATTPLSSTS